MQAVLLPKKCYHGIGYEWSKKLYNFDLSVLRRLVDTLFQREEVPTIAKELQHFKKNDTLPAVSTATLQRILKKLGFQYKKRSRNTLLIEVTHFVQCRHRHLRHVAELRH